MTAHEVTVGTVADFPDGVLVAVRAGDRKVIVARSGDQVHAAVNRCPHLGWSLTRGPGGLRYADGVVQCPWHNSRFDLRTGENLDWVGGIAGRATPAWSRKVIGLGRKPSPLTTVTARVANGNVVVGVEK